MPLVGLENLVQYVTNAEGIHTEVVVPIALWNEVLIALGRSDSGLHAVDEDEPKERILADLEESVRSARRGDIFPVSELWSRVALPEAVNNCGDEHPLVKLSGIFKDDPQFEAMTEFIKADRQALDDSMAQNEHQFDPLEGHSAA
jgi:hypothetical protein